ncbi:hypothetical protein [Peribacillus simplex]|nr:hypothetical protein [Peribacillus simplex]
MMKNKYSKWLLVVVICMGVAIGGYMYYSSIAIGGTPDNGMWKANYKKTLMKQLADGLDMFNKSLVARSR